MKKFISLLILVVAAVWSFRSMMPTDHGDIDTPTEKFSTDRALLHVKAISQKPHYVGSAAHAEVREYIINQFEKLGLKTEVQEGYTLDSYGNLAKPKNILTRIKGSENGKALLLLTHYDSDPHSSLGASDAGSGVATILEGVRAYLAQGVTSKNDIIILITDAEELGLNGAELFVNKHPWAKDIGLVLNFEARGSGGPSYMLIETNGGNAKIIKGFKEANPEFPVSNSLAYSIYKMLPNDTDLTIFREDGNIDGFNLAFIDDHYDYHTVNDNYENLDRNTLEHQGSYLIPLMDYFANANLSDVKTSVDDDYNYFNSALGFFIYPFTWIFPMLILAFVLFIAVIAYGIKNQRMTVANIFKGFIPFLCALLVSALLCHFGWQLMLKLYPNYQDIQHGFTYNGHTYIWFVVMLSLAITFWCYKKFMKIEHVASYAVAPIFLWLVINTGFALALKGASFFIIPVYFALLMLFVFIRQKEPSIVALSLVAIPILLIIAPFIKMFPVGLGLKILSVSAVFTILTFGLLLPVVGRYRRKKTFAWVFAVLALFFFLKAHFNAGYDEQHQKPNSLVYTLNADDNTATWSSYDNVLDSWTLNFIKEDQNDIADLNKNVVDSKYGTGYNYASKAPIKAIAQPKIDITKDTIVNNARHIELCIAPQRFVNRIELFADANTRFNTFSVNGQTVAKDADKDMVLAYRWDSRILSYYMADQEPLELRFSVPVDQKTTITLHEASYDLLENEQFTVPARESDMIPKPFVLNDAIVVKKTIQIE